MSNDIIDLTQDIGNGKKQGTQYPNWCFTFNYGREGQPTKEDVLTWWDDIASKTHWAVAGWEVGPKSGQPHLQGYVQWIGKRRLSELKRHRCGNTVSFRVADGDEESNWNYCTKDGDFLQHGDEPRVINGGMREKKRWKITLDLIKDNKIDDIEPQLQITQCRNIEFLRRKYAKRPADLAYNEKHTRWIYGPSGSGKSRWARELMAGKTWYDKSQNKWWDYYEDEEFVLIDDLEKENAKCLIAFLKRWFDVYPFVAEVKQGVAKYLRPKKMIITANWHPHEIFGDVAGHWEPIERRVEIVYMGPLDKKYVMPSPGNSVAFTPVPLQRSDSVVPGAPKLTRTRAIRPETPVPIDLTGADEEDESEENEDEDDETCSLASYDKDKYLEALLMMAKDKSLDVKKYIDGITKNA